MLIRVLSHMTMKRINHHLMTYFTFTFPILKRNKHELGDGVKDFCSFDDDYADYLSSDHNAVFMRLSRHSGDSSDSISIFL